jgi:hypothetical protein
LEYFTSLTLDLRTGVEEGIEKVRGREKRSVGSHSSMTDETEVEKSFWFRRPDDWVINMKM